MFLDDFALGVLFFMALTLFCGVIAIHEIPHLLSKPRHHPHQDAIQVADWVSLFTLHAIWSFPFIWATIYREDRSWSIQPSGKLQAEVVANAEVSVPIGCRDEQRFWPAILQRVRRLQTWVGPQRHFGWAFHRSRRLAERDCLSGHRRPASGDGHLCQYRRSDCLCDFWRFPPVDSRS